jgi:hypothetical protein
MRNSSEIPSLRRRNEDLGQSPPANGFLTQKQVGIPVQITEEDVGGAIKFEKREHRLNFYLFLKLTALSCK